MKNEEKSLYDIFLSYSYSDVMKLFESAKTKEEKDFYANLSNIILQNEQMKVIGR